jgi:hypothetical protein
MTGSGLAVIAIPIAGTIFLGVWLGLVFYAGGPRRVGGNLVPGHEKPGLAALADRRQQGACSPDPAGQAQDVAVEAAAAVQVAGAQEDPAAQNVHATIPASR